MTPIHTPTQENPLTLHANIPLVDLRWQVDQISPHVFDEIRRVIETTSFVLGDDVSAFERAYADYCGTSSCIGVGNGTDAIELALRAAGLGAGDEVIVPANTYVASVEGIERAGATPVLADCTPDYLIDPESVASKLSSRTRAVLAVHLYGQMAPMAQLRDAVPDRVEIIEDAAQSQGATQNGQRAGSVGLAAATSFYPGKNLGAFGDAGAVTTGSDDLAGRVRLLRNHGGIQRYEHLVSGTNSRLDAIQAVVLLAKLARLDAWNELRVEAAHRYNELLAGVDGVVTPEVAAGNGHVWHLYVVRVAERARVLEALQAAGVGAGLHYPRPVHLLAPFSHLGEAGGFPVAESTATQILSLPMYPGITAEQQATVADVLSQCVVAKTLEPV